MIERVIANPVVLHIRARRVPLFLAGLVVISVAGWALAEWLMARPWSPGPLDRLPVTVIAPLLAAVLACEGLGHLDDELEGSTAIRWRLVRLAHVAVALAVGAIAMALIGLTDPRVYGAYELVRNTAGFLGVAALGTAILGAKMGWVPAVMYGVAVIAVVPRPVEHAAVWWTWPVQPWEVTSAASVAVVWLVLGAAVYTLRGARRSRDVVET